jgi:hypothetical protein
MPMKKGTPPNCPYTTIDYISLLRAEVTVNRVVYVGQRGGVHLHIGWICGNEEFLVK